VVSELVLFLRARLDEDEQAARATTGGKWYSADVLEVNLAAPRPDAEHIARHDPARVLAEVNAKRRILDEIVPKVESYWGAVNSEWGCEYDDPDGDDVLRLLALPYADHPDYDPAWRP
jgi:hypothetical protein